MGNYSESFGVFMRESGELGKAFQEMNNALYKESALDPKTQELVFLSALAAVRHINSMTFHVQAAKKNGATREEVVSAVLTGLPLAGLQCTEALPAALEVYDNFEVK